MWGLEYLSRGWNVCATRVHTVYLRPVTPLNQPFTFLNLHCCLVVFLHVVSFPNGRFDFLLCWLIHNSFTAHFRRTGVLSVSKFIISSFPSLLDELLNNFKTYVQRDIVTSRSATAVFVLEWRRFLWSATHTTMISYFVLFVAFILPGTRYFLLIFLMSIIFNLFIKL